MSLYCSVPLKTKRVVTTEKQKIDAISVAGEVIGFVCINTEDDDSATAFNADGRMSDAHCPVCALKALFAWKSGMTEEVIEVSRDKNPASLILSAILSSAVKH
ncbi:hypothetical protein [Pantoea sp.]|uniref:hypothetical protein n=1 Tax=Pantoea sp. TaxID=69393 RepID=UPI0028AA71DD|nr:hypothetical protein [Pantoea sp.]